VRNPHVVEVPPCILLRSTTTLPRAHTRTHTRRTKLREGGASHENRFGATRAPACVALMDGKKLGKRKREIKRSNTRPQGPQGRKTSLNGSLLTDHHRAKLALQQGPIPWYSSLQRNCSSDVTRICSDRQRKKRGSKWEARSEKIPTAPVANTPFKGVGGSAATQNRTNFSAPKTVGHGLKSWHRMDEENIFKFVVVFILYRCHYNAVFVQFSCFKLLIHFLIDFRFSSTSTSSCC
jgi:hypothetical protein